MKGIVAGTLTCLVVAFGAGTAQAAWMTVFQDDFEQEPLGSVANYTSFVNWDVKNGTVDKLQSGVSLGIACAGGSGICVDMDGSSSNAGDLVSKTAFAFGAGQMIRLMFDFSGNQRSGSDTMTVSLGSFFSEPFDAQSNQAYQTVVRTFTATSAGPANLIFSHDGGDNVGLILDNVKLEVEAVPVPATLATLGLGLAGITLFRRRRRSQAV